MTEPFQFRALLLKNNQLLNSNFGLKYGLASNLLDLKNQVFVPLLILFICLLFVGHFVLLMELIGRTVRVIKINRIDFVCNWFVEHFFDELTLQWLVIQVNWSQDLLYFLVVGFQGVNIQLRQDVFLLNLVEHLEHWVYELKGADSFARKLLIGSFFDFGLLWYLCDELLHLAVVCEIYRGQVLSDFLLVILSWNVEQCRYYFLSFLCGKHQEDGIIGLESLLDVLGELLKILVLHNWSSFLKRCIDL